MREDTSFDPEGRTARSTMAMPRAAGSATVIAGGLTLLYGVIAEGVLRIPVSGGRTGLVFALGLLLCVLGAMTMRSLLWSCWATMIVAAMMLASELWTAYAHGRPDGTVLSVFSLVVPLIVLVLNTLTVGSLRDLRNRS
jgi:hypothetical protein